MTLRGSFFARKLNSFFSRQFTMIIKTTQILADSKPAPIPAGIRMG